MFIRNCALALLTVFNAVKAFNHCLTVKEEKQSLITYSPGHLVNAIIEGKKNLVISILENQPELIDMPDDKGLIPLHAAVSIDNAELALVLLECGAKVNVRCELDDSTALHIVKSRKIARLLMQWGAFLNAKDCWQETPLHKMASSGKKDIVSLLIKYQEIKLSSNLEGKSAYDIAYESKEFYKYKGKSDRAAPFEEICNILSKSGLDRSCFQLRLDRISAIFNKFS